MRAFNKTRPLRHKDRDDKLIVLNCIRVGLHISNYHLRNESTKEKRNISYAQLIN